MSENERVAGRKYLESYLNAHIGRGNKRYHTMVPHEFKDLKLEDYLINKVDPYDSRVYVEESVDISMRESDFQRLLDMLGYFQKHNSSDYYSRDIERRIAFERTLREKHPGIKKAYERYRILIDMAAQGKEIED